MKLRFILTPFLLLATIIVVAQEDYSNNQIDSVLYKINFKKIKGKENELEILKNLYITCSNNKYEIGKSLCLMNISQYQSDIGNYKQAIINAEQANKIALNLKNDSLVVYSSFALSKQYGRIGLNRKALTLINYCINNADAIRDMDSKNYLLGQLYTYKSHFSAGLPNPLTTREYLYNHKKAFGYYTKLRGKVSNSSYSNIGQCYFELKKYDSAFYYFNKAVNDSKKFTYKSVEYEYANMAEVYFTIKEYNLALKYLDSSTSISKKKNTFYLLENNYRIYKEIYKRLNDQENTLKYQNLELSYKDSIRKFDETNVKVALNYIVKKSDLQIIKEKKKMATIIAIVILIALGILFFLITRDKIRSKIPKINNLKTVKTEKTDKTDKTIDIESGMLDSYKEVLRLAKKNDPLFICFFKELYPCFYDSLLQINPDLTYTELKICFYMKLKFTTKEISQATFVSVKAIQNRKNRLRKRFCLDEGEDLYLWIDQI